MCIPKQFGIWLYVLKPNEYTSMWSVIKRVFMPTPFQKIQKALGSDLGKVIVASIPCEEEGRAKILLFLNDHGHDRRVHYIHLTGPRMYGVGTCSFDKDLGDDLLWDGNVHLVRASYLESLVTRLERDNPKGMRHPLWVDPLGRKWYYTRSANLQSRGVRGKSFNLHRVREDGEPEHAWVVQHVVTGFLPFYAGKWLTEETPVYDPQAYETVREADLYEAAYRELEARWPARVQNAIVLGALQRISRHLNIPQPELDRMIQFQDARMEQVKVDVQKAIDDPRINFIPFPLGPRG